MAGSGSNSAGPSCLERLTTFCRTQKGCILAAEIVLSLVTFICYAASLFTSFITVAICEMVFASIFFVVFMMRMDEQFPAVHWLWSDFLRAAAGSILYLIISLFCVTQLIHHDALFVGGMVGLFAGLLFAYDTFTIVLQIRSSRQHMAANTGGRV